MLEFGSLTTHRHNGALFEITKWAYYILISKTMNLNIQTNKQLECRFQIRNLLPMLWGHPYKILFSNNLGTRRLQTPK